MSGLSDYAEQAAINAFLRGTNFTAPTVASLRLGLFTADPTDAGNINEVGTGTWYSRQLTGTFTAPSPSGSANQSSNVASITFPAVTVAAVTVTHIGIFDAATAGNMLFSAPMTSSKTLQVGDVLSFAPGTLVASID
ncbi:hypothetical protein [Herminiimonas sp. CN]|uniref:phage tail fiber protein n=1 Tax=Herminiimonas sp. CN TaxID=1349818 RepID=UPI0004738C55|nr:hypothetical protein [Herminiimonas sp. CN]